MKRTASMAFLRFGVSWNWCLGGADDCRSSRTGSSQVLPRVLTDGSVLGLAVVSPAVVGPDVLGPSVVGPAVVTDGSVGGTVDSSCPPAVDSDTLVLRMMSAHARRLTFWLYAFFAQRSS